MRVIAALEERRLGWRMCVSKVSAVSLWWIRPTSNAPLSGVRAMRHMGASDGDRTTSKRA
ncbi:hypothetical protein TIFTF001_028203 [Ficus carica]|uniref:Uncharacterized protein n=1 Tax=Ficus carica TaxID=3494 RepID=A0AA88DPC5_FICCA|nr:hypothetical protein TIFTF001_028203 [Ficus carica]